MQWSTVTTVNSNSFCFRFRLYTKDTSDALFDYSSVQNGPRVRFFQSETKTEYYW